MKGKLIIIIFILLIAVVGLINRPDTDSKEGTHEADLITNQEKDYIVYPAPEVVMEGLGQIWAIDFIPDTTIILATENSGKLFLIDSETKEVSEVFGVPTVDSRGQGGLLDIAISPNFANDMNIYFTYSAAGIDDPVSSSSPETTTHLAKANLDIDSLVLRDLEVLYIAKPFKNSTSHYGSRVVIDDNYIFMTIGDRGDKNFSNHVSQDTTNVLGTTIRLNRDGSIPDENPFVNNDSILDEIYSFGHRNSQGMAINPITKELWQSEHGEFDGDEINVIKPGGNYGWPLTHTGCGYITKRPIGELPWERDDIIDPVHYWECGTGGFPPSGMVFYDSEGFTDWHGDLFVGGLASRYLAHFEVVENSLIEKDPLLKDEGWRIRDVAVGQHDDAIYVAVEGAGGSIIRIVPTRKYSDDL